MFGINKEYIWISIQSCFNGIVRVTEDKEAGTMEIYCTEIKYHHLNNMVEQKHFKSVNIALTTEYIKESDGFKSPCFRITVVI